MNSVFQCIILSSILAASTLVFAAYPDNPKNGQVYESEITIEVWNARTAEWVAPETFWLRYAQRGKGKFWGRASSYPTFSTVNEFDTILIELDKGVCLMEFFHQRWRRAQDVRRWDTAFNHFGGCPYVFD
ncbi:MAG: hypothetical protein K0U72_17995 [Gammaproteobacteria bacterium]|nr:hypothetical protein [Gammaproteobacteria bacterium]